MAVDGKYRAAYKPPGMSSDVIIFHPGSRHLYFGRATDSEPHSILHIIARRRKQIDSKIHRDAISPTPHTNLNEEALSKIASCRNELLQTLDNSLQKNKNNKSLCEKCCSENKPTPVIVKNESRSITSSISSILSKKEIKQETGVPLLEFENCQYVVGSNVLKIAPEQPYNIHCPWKRGQLNLHKEVGGSLTSVITDLEHIWRWCLEEKLGVRASEFQKYKAVVIIPAMFDRVHAREIIDMVINRLGFRCAFLMQDHVCASFGSGVSCACVVDIGDQKISVSCVEDGVSYPQSRIELKFGGGDLTIGLWHELQLISFIPEPVDLMQHWDLEYFNALKEVYCHLDWNKWGYYRKEPKIIIWNKPGHKQYEYKVHFGNELMLVPLSYFHPEILRMSLGKKSVIFYEAQPSVSDDPLDRMYLMETSKKQCLKTNEEDSSHDDESSMSVDEPTSDHKSNSDALLGVDRAILRSIERCNVRDDNLLHRLSSNILLVGGGCKIIGFSGWLTNRLKILMSENRKKVNSTDSEQFCCRIASSSRQGDPAVATWKGAAILSSLETSKDLWIGKKEWTTQGSKILREKSLFQF